MLRQRSREEIVQSQKEMRRYVESTVSLICDLEREHSKYAEHQNVSSTSSKTSGRISVSERFNYEIGKSHQARAILILREIKRLKQQLSNALNCFNRTPSSDGPQQTFAIGLDVETIMAQEILNDTRDSEDSDDCEEDQLCA